jgi:HPt (histidine-containing phosphotransfer) domain-containing protein
MFETTHDVRNGLRQLEEDYGKEMVMKIVEIFIPDAEARLEKIGEAIELQDFKALEEAAHGLKGGAANIGAMEMSRLCQQLETQGELGSIGDAPEVMKMLVASWTLVRTQITRYH